MTVHTAGVVQVTTAFDHETEPESVVVLTVTDSGSPPRSMDKSITVIVEDVNEAPSGLTLSASKVCAWLGLCCDVLW